MNFSMIFYCLIDLEFPFSFLLVFNQLFRVDWASEEMIGGGSISMLVVLLGSTGYAMRYRAYQPGYGGRRAYYPGYSRQSNTARYRIRPEDRNNSTDIEILPAEEMVKPLQGLRVSQTVEIRNADKEMSAPGIEAAREEPAIEINHQIGVKQSVLWKIEHYHIQAADKVDKAQKQSEKASEGNTDMTETVIKAAESKENDKPSIAFNIWGNKEVNLSQEGDRVYNTYKGDTVYNYGGMRRDEGRVPGYGGKGDRPRERVSKQDPVYSDYPDSYYDYGYYYSYQ